MTDYGTFIKARRKQLHMSQDQVADIACCHRTTIGRFEKGDIAMQLDIFLGVLNALGLKMEIKEADA